MTVSILIATYNRAPLLANCLQHLARQHFGAGDEVVVVNNGSTDDTARTIEDARARFAVPLRHLHEGRPGKSHALAAALDIARGNVIAFTDDDVTMDERWLDTIRRIMTESDAALVGGPVVPRWETAPPRWLSATAGVYGRLAAPLGLLNYGHDSFELGPRTVLGANLVVRRHVLMALGGFATHLGKLRGTLLSGEDHELCQRVQAAGFHAVYCPDLSVSHWVPAERMRASYSMSWFFWSGITQATLEASERRRTPRFLRVPRHFVKRAALASIHSVGAALHGRSAALMDNAVDVAFVAGYAARCWGVGPGVQS